MNNPVYDIITAKSCQPLTNPQNAIPPLTSSPGCFEKRVQIFCFLRISSSTLECRSRFPHFPKLLLKYEQ